MNKGFLELRGAIWHVVNMKVFMLFENVEDEEDEYAADLEVNLNVGKYLGATTWTFENGGGALAITLYPTGLIEANFNEMSHKERVITIAGVPDSKKIGVDEILADINTFVDIFLYGNFHVFNDFMSKYPTDWKKAVEEYENYLIDNPEDATIEITYITC